MFHHLYMLGCLYKYVLYKLLSSRDSLLVERRTRDRKVTSSNPGRSGGRIFFHRVNFLCWLLFDVRSIPVSPQWHVKDPDQSAKSAGGRLRLNTYTTLIQRSRSGLTILSKHSVGTHQGSELTRDLSGNTLPQSPQLAEPLWTDPGLISEIGVGELISTLKINKKKIKKRKRGINRSTFPPKFPQARKKTNTISVKTGQYIKGLPEYKNRLNSK